MKPLFPYESSLFCNYNHGNKVSFYLMKNLPTVCALFVRAEHSTAITKLVTTQSLLLQLVLLQDEGFYPFWR